MYLTFDVISVGYIEKGTSLMTSQWRSRWPLTSSNAVIRQNITVLFDDLGQINGATALKQRKRLRMEYTSFWHGTNSLPLVSLCGYWNLPALSIVIPRLAFGRAWYSRFRVTKQRVTISASSCIINKNYNTFHIFSLLFHVIRRVYLLHGILWFI